MIKDFNKIVDMMKEHNLIKVRNLSCYNYYIFRLVSKNNIPLINKQNDLKHNRKTKNYFDYRLFGISKMLGFDKDCKCPYYLKWLDKQKNKHVSTHMIITKLCIKMDNTVSKAF